MLQLCCFGAGCSLAHTAAHNVCQIPREWWQERREDERNLMLAKEAWLQASAATGGIADTAFMDGFVDGFTDYLKYGGSGQPPALPPVKLRTQKCPTPAGRAAAESWFAGFRFGANWARSSGQRMNTVYPVAIAPHPCAHDPYAIGPGPYVPPFVAAPPPRVPEDRVIPSAKISALVPAVAPFSFQEANPHLGKPQPKAEDDLLPATRGPELRLTPQLRKPASEGTDG